MNIRKILPSSGEKVAHEMTVLYDEHFQTLCKN
jgi:hypothetical protein